MPEGLHKLKDEKVLPLSCYFHFRKIAKEFEKDEHVQEQLSFSQLELELKG